MSSQTIKLNLIPQGEMPVFYASQFDNGRLINIELYNGTDEYELPEGYTAELHCRKADNNIVTLSTSQVTANLIKFSSTTQLTACYGNNLCEVSIMDTEDTVIGTLNFILEVEKDPLQGGITSTSEIHDLETQIEEITTEIVGENYYDKSEVDDLLSAKADSDSVYTIGEVNTLLSGKANAADVYTKSQTDTLLSAKADSSDVYTKTETNSLLNGKLNTYQMANTLPLGDVIAAKVQTAYDSEHGSYDKVSNVALDVYTKAQVDNIILDIMPVGTASGPIATFDTELATPLVNGSCNIVATGGNGTPDNPNPINGYTEANITANGNVITISFGQTVYGGVLDVTRGKLTVTHGKYTLDNTATAGQFDINTYTDRNRISYVPYQSDGKTNGTFKADKLETAPNAPGGIGTGDYQIFGSTTAPRMWITVPTTIATVADFLTYISSNPIDVVYELATPFGIDLTPEVISAIVGTNNVYSDTNGDTTVQYKDSIQHYINNHTGG